MRVAVVGNAPELAGYATQIDAADHVLRFNNATGWRTTAGSRIDELVMVNCGGQMREWLADAYIFATGPSAAAPAITFPIHPDVADLFPPSGDPTGTDGENFAGEAKALALAAGKHVTMIPAATYARACELVELGPFRLGMGAPSSGFLVLLRMVETVPDDTRIDVYGYGFDGWEGHAWAQEEAWTRAMHAAGRLNLHPLRHGS